MNPLRETGVTDLRSKPLLKGPELRRSLSDDHRSPVRPVWKDLNHGIHKFFGSFLRPDAAEHPDSMFARKPPIIPCGCAVGWRRKHIDIHAVWNDGGVPVQVAGRGSTCGNQSIHTTQTKSCDPAVPALRRRREDEQQPEMKDIPEDEPHEHVDVAPGVPNAPSTTPAMTTELPDTDLRNRVPNVETQCRDPDAFRLFGQHGGHARIDTRISNA